MDSRSLVQIVGKAAKTRGFKPEKPIVDVPGCVVRVVGVRSGPESLMCQERTVAAEKPRPETDFHRLALAVS